MIKLLRTTSLFVLVLLSIVHFTPLTPWYSRLLAGDWTDASGDVLIVLSSEIERDGVLGYSSFLRCLYAVRAYRQSPFRAIVLSGGGTPDSPSSIAAAMRDFLAAYGVPRDIMVLEDRSVSTRENALYTTALVGGWPGRKILLTSDYHMFRAQRAFAKAGLPVTPRPFPDALKRSNSLILRWPTFWGLITETTKIVYYRIRGWI